MAQPAAFSAEAKSQADHCRHRCPPAGQVFCQLRLGSPLGRRLGRLRSQTANAPRRERRPCHYQGRHRDSAGHQQGHVEGRARVDLGLACQPNRR